MDHISPNTERRRFSRILFDATATLTAAGVSHSGRIIDISLKGALVQSAKQLPVRTGDEIALWIALAGTNKVIWMRAKVTHIEGNQLGLTCLEIDMESIGHLRRLVELNLGEQHLLERELAGLG